jgi:hypothetical protein
LTTSNNHQNVSITRVLSSSSPLNHTYHNSLRRIKNDERCFFRNNSLKRSLRINNDSSSYFTPHVQQMPHHCTIELKTKASSCLHLFHKNSPPVLLTTFKNPSDVNDPNDQQKNNEILWRYHLSQCDLNRKIKASSQCNLNNLCHNYHHCYHRQQPQQQSIHSNNNKINNNNSSANETPTTTIMETKFLNSIENKTTL